jgi:hypothetical protein
MSVLGKYFQAIRPAPLVPIRAKCAVCRNPPAPVGHVSLAACQTMAKIKRW